MSASLALYALLGPGLWLVLCYLIAAGKRKMRRLQELGEEWKVAGGPAFDRAPRVTILVPVKDEAEGIADCVAGLLAQDYPDFDVLVMNDRSTDGTGAILDDLAARHDRLRVRHLTHLPPGWLGKPHALNTALLEEADRLGEWLLLVDSDVVTAPEALSHAIKIALDRGYDLVTLMTGLIAPTFAERLITPAAAGVWSAIFTVSWTNEDSMRDRAAANGQFLLIRRNTLEGIGGHAAVRDRTCEDVEIARLVKKAGGTVRYYLGQHLARTRMHKTPREMFNGWGRNFAGSARHKPARLIAAMPVLVTGLVAWPAVVAAVVAAAPWWIAIAGLQVAAVTAAFALVYRGRPSSWPSAVGYGLLHPFTIAFLLALLGNGVRGCYGGTVQWRGATVKA